MAEVLAVVGGAAAGSQLLHYGFQALKAASALPRYLRHSPEMVQAWIYQASAMLQYLDDIQHRRGTLNISTSRLLELCRKDAVALQTMLVPFQSAPQVRERSRLRELWFVLRKDHEVERIIGEFIRKYSMATLSLSL
jgi:hypothetical protein